MACIRKLYFDLINDYDAYYDENELHNMSNSEILYNLKEMKKEFEQYNSIDEFYNRVCTLIELFQALKIN